MKRKNKVNEPKLTIYSCIDMLLEQMKYEEKNHMF